MKSQTFRVFSGNEKSLLKIKIITRCIFQTIKCAVAGHQYMVMDLPLLFEAGVMVKYMHKIIGTATTLFYNINLVIQIWMVWIIQVYWYGMNRFWFKPISKHKIALMVFNFSYRKKNRMIFLGLKF